MQYNINIITVIINTNIILLYNYNYKLFINYKLAEDMLDEVQKR